LSSNDLAADLGSGLEVNQNAGLAPNGDASSPSGPAGYADPDGAGNPPSGDANSDLRKALNRSSEARKIARGLESEVRSLREMNQQLLQAIAGGSPGNGANALSGNQRAPGNDKPPFSQADLEQMAENGEQGKLLQAMQANHDWQRGKDKAEFNQHLDQTLQRRDEGTALNMFLMQELGLGDTNSELSERIESEAAQIRQKFPSIDKATALVLASGKVHRGAALGTLELETDLREEHLRRTNRPDSTPQPSAQPAPQKISWESPNRGLPAALVQRMNEMGLGNALKKSDNPALEAEYRRIVDDIVTQQAANAHRKKMGVYR
jgi:hypothetical protein